MVELAERIAAQKLSVRDTERLVKQAKAPAPVQPAKKQTPEARKVVEELQRVLGTKVRLSDNAGKGTLEIDFFSYADLDRILALLRK